MDGEAIIRGLPWKILTTTADVLLDHFTQDHPVFNYTANHTTLFLGFGPGTKGAGENSTLWVWAIKEAGAVSFCLPSVSFLCI